MPRNCLNNTNSFSFIYGEWTFESECILMYTINRFSVGFQSKSWVAHICGVTCVRHLLGWDKEKS